MRKRNIAFILFAVAAMNILTLPTIPFIFDPLWTRLGLPPSLKNITYMISYATGFIAASILLIAGIIVFFKFRSQEKKLHHLYQPNTPTDDKVL